MANTPNRLSREPTPEEPELDDEITNGQYDNFDVNHREEEGPRIPLPDDRSPSRSVHRHSRTRSVDRGDERRHPRRRTTHAKDYYRRREYADYDDDYYRDYDYYHRDRDDDYERDYRRDDRYHHRRHGRSSRTERVAERRSKRSHRHHNDGTVSISETEYERLQDTVRRLSTERDNLINKVPRKHRQLPNNLPKFSGLAQDYLAWSSSFKANIGNEDGYTVTQKISALIDCVSHLPNMDPIALYPKTEKGLQEACEYVEGLFGDTARVIEESISKLEKLKHITEVTLENITQLRATFMSATTSVELMGRMSDYRHRIRTAIMSKIPDHLHRDITDLEPTEDSFLKVVLEQLTKEHKRAKELDARKKVRESNTKTVAKKRPVEQSQQPTSLARAYAVHSEPTSKKRFICRFDGGLHRFRDCPTPIETRRRNMIAQNCCLRCLGPGHKFTECKGNRVCEYCKGKHHTYLCRNAPVSTLSNNGTQQEIDDTLDEGEEVKVLKIFTPMSFKTILLKEQDTRLWIRPLVDEGSSGNFITKTAAQRLGTETYVGAKLKVYSFGEQPPLTTSIYVDLMLQSNLTQEWTRVTFAVVPSIGNSAYPIPPEWVLGLMDSQDRCSYRDDPNVPVEAIVGLHETQLWMKDSTILTNDSRGRYSIQRSTMGTFLFGGNITPNHSQVYSTFTFAELQAEVENSSLIPPDDFVEKFLQNHVRAIEGRIEVDVPIVNRVKLQSNARKCYKIMTQNVAKWRKSGKLDIVLKILEEWKTDGIIEKVTHLSPGNHVLSYHVVEKPSSDTTKYRLVYNGSLPDFFGNHLNHKVFKGRTSWKICQSITELRRSQYSLIGDIRQAFLMVQVAAGHRSLFQFYWPDDKQELLYQFTRVPFGTSASPFLLFAAIRKVIELQSERYPSLSTLIDWFYVDDLVCSFDSSEERDRVRADIDFVMSQYGFSIGWSDADVNKTLGLETDRKANTIKVLVPHFDSPQTLRDLASIIPQYFDPCGYTAPIGAELRRIFSDCWKAGIRWDDPIEYDELFRIEKMLNILQTREYSIPLWIGSTRDSKLELHLFTDANEQNIGAVIYSKNPLDNKLVLIFAKSILHRRNTVPEAELDALILGIKLVDKYYSAEVGQLFIWTDSMINRDRINTKSINSLKYQQSRKVLAAWETLDKYSYTVGHVPTKDNPADLLTKFEHSDFPWSFWKSPPIPVVCSSEVSMMCKATTTTEPMPDYTEIYDFLESANTLQDCTEKYPLNDLIIAAQRHTWGIEITALIQRKKLPKANRLGPYWYEITDDILMAKLRDDDVNSLIPLPRLSPLVALLAQQIHLDHHHLGGDSVHQLLTEKYISRGCRRTVRKVIGRCEQCTRVRGRLQRQIPAPLPLYRRVPPTRAFTNCGVDFAGPMNTRDGPRHVILFTCFHSRAISLRLLKSADAPGILTSLLLHSALYGLPATMYSDNAKSFVKADKVLRTLYQQHRTVVTFLKWTYSYPGDPASNGVTESMIGVMKKYLKGLTFGKQYSENELEIYLAEAQRGANNRPLFVCDGEVITPQHFITGDTILPVPQPNLTKLKKLDVNMPFLIRRRVTHFWRSWKKKEMLRRRTEQRQTPRRNFQIGDYAIYEPFNIDDRARWPTCQVIAVYPSKDDNVRRVDIKLWNGQVLLDRPVGKLILLEQRPAGPEADSRRTAHPAISTLPTEESDGFFDPID